MAIIRVPAKNKTFCLTTVPVWGNGIPAPFGKMVYDPKGDRNPDKSGFTAKKKFEANIAAAGRAFNPVLEKMFGGQIGRYLGAGMLGSVYTMEPYFGGAELVEGGGIAVERRKILKGKEFVTRKEGQPLPFRARGGGKQYGEGEYRAGTRMGPITPGQQEQLARMDKLKKYLVTDEPVIKMTGDAGEALLNGVLATMLAASEDAGEIGRPFPAMLPRTAVVMGTQGCDQFSVERIERNWAGRKVKVRNPNFDYFAIVREDLIDFHDYSRTDRTRRKRIVKGFGPYLIEAMKEMGQTVTEADIEQYAESGLAYKLNEQIEELAEEIGNGLFKVSSKGRSLLAIGSYNTRARHFLVRAIALNTFAAIANVVRPLANQYAAGGMSVAELREKLEPIVGRHLQGGAREAYRSVAGARLPTDAAQRQRIQEINNQYPGEAGAISESGYDSEVIMNTVVELVMNAGKSPGYYELAIYHAVATARIALDAVDLTYWMIQYNIASIDIHMENFGFICSKYPSRRTTSRSYYRPRLVIRDLGFAVGQNQKYPTPGDSGYDGFQQLAGLGSFGRHTSGRKWHLRGVK